MANRFLDLLGRQADVLLANFPEKCPDRDYRSSMKNLDAKPLHRSDITNLFTKPYMNFTARACETMCLHLLDLTSAEKIPKDNKTGELLECCGHDLIEAAETKLVEAMRVIQQDEKRMHEQEQQYLAKEDGEEEEPVPDGAAHRRVASQLRRKRNEQNRKKRKQEAREQRLHAAAAVQAQAGRRKP